MSSTRGKSFTPEQDEAICRAYLSVTKDPIVGNSQPRSQFWARVLQEYKAKINVSQRSESSMKSRWQIIQKCRNKFRGCLKIIEALHQSGVTRQNQFDMAKKSYFDDTGKYFAGMDGCWMILAESVKWQDINPGRKLKTHEASEFDDIMSSPISLEDNQVPSSFESVDGETTPGSGSVSSPRKRPAGTKLARRDKLKNKIHEVDNARYINLLETLNKTMADNSARRIELEERKVTSLERQTVCEEKETERKDREMEERIMAMDLSAIQDPDMKAYYQLRRTAILAKWSSLNSTTYYTNILEY